MSPEKGPFQNNNNRYRRYAMIVFEPSFVRCYVKPRGSKCFCWTSKKLNILLNPPKAQNCGPKSLFYPPKMWNLINHEKPPILVETQSPRSKQNIRQWRPGPPI